MPRLFAIATRTLSLLGSRSLVRTLRYDSWLLLGTDDLPEWFINIVLVMLIISSSPKSESFIDCYLTVEYISSESAFKIIAVKRLSDRFPQIVEFVTKLKYFLEKHFRGQYQTSLRCYVTTPTVFAYADEKL